MKGDDSVNYERIILEMLERIRAAEERIEALEARLNAADTPAAEPSRRTGLTMEAIDACYDLALRLEQQGGADASRAIAELAQAHGCKPNYAICFVSAVRAMVNGREFKFAIKEQAARRYFERILTDFGKQGLRKALTAARAHVAYQQSKGNPARGMEALCRQYEARAL